MRLKAWFYQDELSSVVKFTVQNLMELMWLIGVMELLVTRNKA